MISRWLSLTLFIVVAPNLSHAQTPYSTSPPMPSPINPYGELGKAPSNFDQEKMYEDIEILRRILDRKLTPLYPSIPSKGERTGTFSSTYSATPNGAASGYLLYTPETVVKEGKLVLESNQGPMWYSVQNAYPASIPLRSLEGIYLKGQGVVFTATVSSLQLPAKAEANSTVRWRVENIRVDSEWDSIRRQVRNEKEKPKKPEESKPPSLSDVLLQLLAENGRHFSQLSENENLMIVVTVREPSAPLPATKPATAQSNSSAAVTDADLQREAGNLGMLGQVHLKHEQYGEALSAFEKMLGRVKSPELKALVHRRLAQCYLGLGQDDKAHAELDKAIELLKQQKEGKAKPTAAKPAGELPVKLIVWAPKKLLDQADKITFEEFRRQASAEVLRFGDRRSRE